MSEFDRESNFAELNEQFPVPDDCLIDQILDALSGQATREQISDLAGKRLDIRGDYGQLICEKAGCMASCVVRVYCGKLTVGSDELLNFADSCKRLTDIAPGR